MNTILKNIVAFTNLSVGVPTAKPHRLNVNGTPVAPKIGGVNVEGFSVTADAVSVTVTRTVHAPGADVEVYVEYWHSVEAVTPLIPPPGKLIGLTPFFFAASGADVSAIVVEDEGAPLPNPPHSILNFIGPGVRATDAGGGVAQIAVPGFEPGRELFVAKSWPTGVDPLVYFTSWQAALNQAALMAPSVANSVGIHIYPGTYTENVVVPAAAASGVCLVGESGNNTILSGNFTWQPVGAGAEVINLVHIRINTGTVTIDSSGKTNPANGSAFTAFNCNFAAISGIGRGLGPNPPVSRDLVSFTSCDFGQGAMVLQDQLAEWNSCRHRGFTLNTGTHGGCIGSLGGGIPIPAATANSWTVNGTSTMKADGTSFVSQWNVNSVLGGSTPAVVFAGCSTNSNVNVANGSKIDITGAQQMRAFIVGTGTGSANRAVDKLLGVATTAPGPNTITIPLPYNDANYTLSWALKSGPGNAAMTVSALAVNQFALTDAVGGNTWDITVTHS